MNKRIKELVQKSGGLPTQNCGVKQFYFEEDELEKFARLIIDECLANPKVYILNRKDNTRPESPTEVYGWTSDLKLAQQWRTSSNRSEERYFVDIYFIKEIKSL